MNLSQIMHVPKIIRSDQSCIFIAEYVKSPNIDFYPEDLLQPEEAHKSREIEDSKARSSYIKSHVVLRAILSCELVCEPAELRFAYASSGKPTLISPIVSNFHFSLSRSHEVACVGLSYKRAIGIDLEVERSAENYQVAYTNALSRRELHWLLRQPKQLRDTEFLRLWTAKEAVLKASSFGLTIAPSKVCTDPAYQTSTGTPARVAVNGTAYRVIYYRVGRIHISVAMRCDTAPAASNNDWNELEI